jgi:DNA polymerase I
MKDVSGIKKWYVFDLETDNLYDKVTKIHCLVLYDINRDQTFTYGPDCIAAGLEHLATADVLIGHNILFFDIAVIRKLYPFYTFAAARIIDTLITTRLIWPKEKLYETDEEQYTQVPPKLRGSASLKAWGYRLSDYKIEFKDFTEYSQEMLDYCMAPHHKVLRDDLTWVECGSIKPGDTILGFDEHGPSRKFKKTKVTVKTFDEAELYRVTLASGKIFDVTKEHRWLTTRLRSDKTGCNQGAWVETQNLRTDKTYCSHVVRYLTPWEEDVSKEAGWLAGIFDGEGTLVKNRVDFSVAQKPGLVLNKIENLLSIKYNKITSKRVVKKESDCITLRFTGNQYSKLEFLGMIRPIRLINKFSFDYMGRMEVKENCLIDDVVSVEPLGKGTIVKLTTDSRTFILDGYPMHNCVQDVSVTTKLLRHIQKQTCSEPALKLEHDFALAIEKQIRSGFPFDVDACLDLVDDLRTKQAVLEADLKKLFPPKKIETVFIPKVNNASRGYVKGQPFTKVVHEEFNPGSRQQIVDRLQTKYGWVPTKSTEKGNPILDDDVLSALPYPEAKPLAEYMLIKKRLGQIADGNNAWLKLVNNETGCIHGDLITNGCITGRCAHRNPNMGQVPASYSDYGKECRSLFHAPDGWTLIGVDAKALELRCLAGYLAHWDDGEYARVVTDDSIDIHVYNQKMFGVETRDIAKRLLYGIAYGCGALKAGTIIDPNEKNEIVLRKLGSTAINSFMQGIPALKKLKDKIANNIAARGYLIGLDGRPLFCRSDFKGLNVLLQSSGALIMKQVVIELHKKMYDLGYIYGHDWQQHGMIHDEIQVSCPPAMVDTLTSVALDAFPASQQFFNFQCSIHGDAHVGSSWDQTH